MIFFYSVDLLKKLSVIQKLTELNVLLLAMTGSQGLTN